MRSTTPTTPVLCLLALFPLACGPSETAEPGAFSGTASAQVETAPASVSADAVEHGEITSPGAPPPVTNAPDVATVEWETDEVDFGHLWQGARPVHTFRGRVTGENELEVSLVKAGCSCTIAESSILVAASSPGAEPERLPLVLGEPLAPGTVLEIVAELDTAGRRGHQDKGVKVYMNVAEGVKLLALSADVDVWLEAAPPRWTTGRMSLGESRTGVVKLVGTTGEPFGLHALEDELLEEVGVELVPTDPDADGRASEWTANLSFGPARTTGVHALAIPFVTDRELEGAPPRPDGSPATHTATVYVQAEVVGAVVPSPRYLSFGLVQPGQATSLTLRLACGDPAFAFPEPVVHVQTPEGEPFPLAQRFQITPRRIEEPNGWDLEIVLDGMPPSSERTFRGRLLIETGHPAEPEVAVNFSGFVKSEADVLELPAAGEGAGAAEGS